MKTRLGDYLGALAEPYANPGFVAQVQDLRARARAERRAEGTGRNQMARIAFDNADHSVMLAVKCFRRQWPLKDVADRMLGTKAERSWQAAIALHKAGVGTPRPVGFLEKWRGPILVESYYLSEYQEDVTSFRLELKRLRAEDPAPDHVAPLLECVAGSVRKMHEANVFHRDLGNQNIILRRTGERDWTDVQFLDLNRARHVRRLTTRQRARELSRLSLPPPLLQHFIERYFAPEPVPNGFERAEHLFRTLYAWHCDTRHIRHPLRTARRNRADAATHPPAPE